MNKKIYLTILFFTTIIQMISSQDEKKNLMEFLDIVQEVKSDKPIDNTILVKYTRVELLKRVENGINNSVGNVIYISDSVLGLTIQESNGIFVKEYLVTFNYSNPQIDKINLTEESFGTQIEPGFMFKDYNLYDNLLVEFIRRTGTLSSDSCVDQSGLFKPGYSNENCIDIDTNYSYNYINNDGLIIEVKRDLDNYSSRKYGVASYRLIKEHELKDYSDIELRYMRNEIFANKGYIFNSADLKAYFSKQTWYNPTSKNVTEDLTLIERKNIELIKSLEKP